MWCVFIITHHLITSTSWIRVGNDWLNPSHEIFRIIAVLTAIFVFVSILNPKKIIWFVLTLISWSLLKLDNLPQIPNHIILALIANFTILMGVFLNRSKGQLIEDRLALIYDSIAPILRWNMIILYFFTVFHKINWDFFNIDVSCAVTMYQDISSDKGFLPDNQIINWSLIFGTVIIETLIPVLLIIPRSRLFGIILGLSFHLLLSFHPNMYITSFSCEMSALFVLFLPNSYIIGISKRLGKWHQIGLNTMKINKLSIYTIFKFTFYLFLLTGIVLILDHDHQDLIVLNKIKIIYRLSLQVVTFLTIVMFLFYSTRVRHDNEKGSFRLQKNVLIVLPILLFFNGVTPYLGLKTATNFSMFSNLRITGTENNSILIPNNFPLVKHSSDIIEIVESNDAGMMKIKNNNEKLTFFEFQRWIHEQNELSKTRTIYIHNQKTIILNLPHDKLKPEYNQISWLEKKLFIYRNIPKDGPCICQW